MKNLIVLILVLVIAACSEPEFQGPNSKSGKSSYDLAATTSPLKDIPTFKDIVEKGVIVGRLTCRVQPGARIFAAQKDGHKFYVFTNGSPSGSACSNIAYNDTGMETVNAGDDITAWNEFNSGICGKTMLWEKAGE